MAAPTARRLRVWDAPTRLFHWALAGLVVTSVVSVKMHEMDVHVLSGQTILGLLLFRLLWGFVGPDYARFASFVRAPTAIVAYIRSLLRPPHAFHAGHNPLGGLVVVLMLLVIGFQAVTGLFANDDIATDGPFVRYVTKATSDSITSWHRLNSYVIYALVGLHVAAVIGYLVVYRENLIAAMVTGYKQLRAGEAARGIEHGRTLLGLVLMALCIGAAGLVVRLPRMLAAG
jgi:cytochrome b